MEEYLRPTFYLDFDQADVRQFALENSLRNGCDKENAARLFNAVRDGFRYDPYRLDLRKEGLRASNLVRRESGYCIEKSILLAAAGRAIGIPSRLSFYIVANHIATEKIELVLKTNKLVFHGATEFYLDEKWRKATPAFDSGLCSRLGVAVLEFDGERDSVFQQFDEEGNVFMEYLHDYGHFDDMPHELAVSEFKKHYPHIIENPAYMKSELVYDLGGK